ncbi:Lcl C-terminal domain-containing protein [Pseudomonas sp. LB3P58]
MKAEMITLKHGETTIKMPASQLAKLALASTFALVLPPAANVQPVAPTNIPALGAEWPGQGGFNGGLVAARGDVPAHYLILAAKDVGDHEWGGRGIELKGLSKTDGYINTQVLIGNDDERKYPAADACAEYIADGHHDFYLPAAAELYQGWLNCPEVFAQDCYYWSSSQRSANSAFLMDFDVGYQYYYVKGNELRVRPVRRFFI